MKKDVDKPNSDETENLAVNDWQDLRNIHSAAFTQLELYLAEKILTERRILALTDVYNYYMRLFTEEKSLSHKESIQLSFKPHHMLEKILMALTSIRKIVYMNRTYLHPEDMKMDEILEKGFTREDDLTTKIKSVATEIRRVINQMELRKLPKQKRHVKDVINGECDIPQELYLLIEAIVQGPYVNQK